MYTQAIMIRTPAEETDAGFQWPLPCENTKKREKKRKENEKLLLMDLAKSCVVLASVYIWMCDLTRGLENPFFRHRFIRDMFVF